MKKFLFLHYGFEEPTAEVMEAWNKWFESISDRMVDMAGLANGLEISNEGRKELPFGKDSITGYNVIKAEDLDEAEGIARKNPFVASIRVYEMRSE